MKTSSNFGISSETFDVIEIPTKPVFQVPFARHVGQHNPSQYPGGPTLHGHA